MIDPKATYDAMWDLNRRDLEPLRLEGPVKTCFESGEKVALIKQHGFPAARVALGERSQKMVSAHHDYWESARQFYWGDK